VDAGQGAHGVRPRRRTLVVKQINGETKIFDAATGEEVVRLRVCLRLWAVSIDSMCAALFGVRIVLSPIRTARHGSVCLAPLPLPQHRPPIRCVTTRRALREDLSFLCQSGPSPHRFRKNTFEWLGDEGGWRRRTRQGVTTAADWTQNDLVDWLHHVGLGDCEETFRR
jgi:hypothetical protein